MPRPTPPKFRQPISSKVCITNTNCGVRVVQDAHRAYMTDYVRDPRTGGCAAGVPPANLGFRIVAEDENGLPCSAW